MANAHLDLSTAAADDSTADDTRPAIREHVWYDDEEALTLPGPSWQVADRLPSRSLTVLYGPPGAGKSTAAVDLACSLPVGLPWLGAAIVEPGPTMYVAGEGVSGYVARLRAWKAHYQVTERIGAHVWPAAVALPDCNEVYKFVAEVSPVAPKLVIFDTLSRCLNGADENSAADMGLVVKRCDLIRDRLGCSIILIHHVGKGKNATTERGSSVLRAACDAVWALTPAKPARDGLEPLCEKMRDGEWFKDVRVKLTPTAGSVVMETLDTATLAPSNAARRVLALLASFGPNGATAADWQHATEAAGVKESTFWTAKRQLLQQGKVQQIGRQFVGVG